MAEGILTKKGFYLEVVKDQGGDSWRARVHFVLSNRGIAKIGFPKRSLAFLWAEEQAEKLYADEVVEINKYDWASDCHTQFDDPHYQPTGKDDE